MEKPKISVSFSGGRTSAYMAFLIKKHWGDSRDLCFIFANTGKENEETLVFADKCDKEFGLNLVWIEAVMGYPYYKTVSFETASRNGEPFEDKIQRYGIPNVAFPWCTRELKMRPIRAAQVAIFGGYDYKTAIGIRMDEFDRMREDRKAAGLIYPLISEWPSTKKDVADFWESMPFDLGLKDYQGNCDLCWKKAMPKLLKICKESPEKAEWWGNMEEKYSSLKPESQPKRAEQSFFNRKHTPVSEIVAIAQAAKYLPIQLSLFNGGSSCDGESCEAF